jgi:hypothetical protein
MPRLVVTVPVLLALALPGAAIAQQSLPTEPPANPNEIVPDQRLEVVDQRLLTAGEQLRRAADARDDDRTQRALGYGRDTLGAVRGVFDDLPAAQRQPFIDAVSEAERVLSTGDPGASADAMQTLQQAIRELARRGA